MYIGDVVNKLYAWAPPAYQESYDNAGLITGDTATVCTGILCTLDATESIIDEAVSNNCNLVVAHHPILFRGLKNFSGNTYVERAIIKAIKNDIAIYAIHTNLDNVLHGVNQVIAAKLGLEKTEILSPKEGLLCKLYTYAPFAYNPAIKQALFAAGAGSIGNYSECSFTAYGHGTFTPLPGSSPLIGSAGSPETVEEDKIEVIFPAHLQRKILTALFAAHPYETVAYEVVRLENKHQQVGSGLIGELPNEMEETIFLQRLKAAFNAGVIKHTPFTGRKIKKVAVCGGAGSFLTLKAIAAGADIFITSDVKYHEFFDADGRLILADIGHWESEQYTADLIATFLQENFPTFAVLKNSQSTNPVRYF